MLVPSTFTRREERKKEKKKKKKKGGGGAGGGWGGSFEAELFGAQPVTLVQSLHMKSKKKTAS